MTFNYFSLYFLINEDAGGQRSACSLHYLQ